jgi:hypothetical protein
MKDHDVPAGIVVAVGVLLGLPVVALLWVSSYAREGPEVAGFPYFYAYQFLWVFLAAGCTWTAFLLLKRFRGDR